MLRYVQYFDSVLLRYIYLECGMYTCIYYIYEPFVIKVIEFTQLWFLKYIDTSKCWYLQ